MGRAVRPVDGRHVVHQVLTGVTTRPGSMGVRTPAPGAAFQPERDVTFGAQFVTCDAVTWSDGPCDARTCGPIYSMPITGDLVDMHR